ncbi:polysaccharide pyruvyl transferase CsaB [Oikeobacillus pervagus]|uniref:Polysaccharide pyruvyl transferase CsaB n=1 Tax=Oikeobacillus pervagus TaxID=1325931 RepID=A0AAJ1SYS6_9BACI|nr:polysaccharide pyruvyl transferase family protein [Oikeobacillus pervagus]MDQ0215303.1 polysaccharide pyruvyl transferase CsaB [Oikeobacillus pervagus]
MKIGIVGNYGHDNNGDEAILEGILHQLTNIMNIPRTDLLIFSNNPENTRRRYHIDSYYLMKKKGSILKTIIATFKQHSKVIQNLDVLIIGGGGILMDMYKRDAPLYSFIAFLGKMNRCKIIVYGVGAGPIETHLGQFLIKQMVHSAKLVTVRDIKSKQLLESKGIKKPIHLIADPAFTLKYDGQKPLMDRPMKIGVTAVPYFSDDYWPVSDSNIYHHYVDGMARNLDKLVEQMNMQIYFYSTKYPQDVKVTKEILNRMKQTENVHINEQNLHPKELIQLSGEMDAIIGTRLHSLILSVAAGTPIIGVNYHPKVKAFMEKIELTGLLVEMEDLSDSNKLYSLIQKQVDVGWKTTQLNFFDLSEKLREETLKGVDLMKTVIERE